jgi:hypothetical protein
MILLCNIAFFTIIFWLLFTKKRSSVAFEAETVAESCSSIPAHKPIDDSLQKFHIGFVQRIVDWLVSRDIADFKNKKITDDEFIKNLSESLRSIVLLHLDKISKDRFVFLFDPFLKGISDLNDGAFLKKVLDLLNDHLGPKGFVFCLENTNGTFQMSCEVAGKPHAPQQQSCVPDMSASVVEQIMSSPCILKIIFPNHFSEIEENSFAQFLKRIVAGSCLMNYPSIRFWLLSRSFFKNIFDNFDSDFLARLGMVGHNMHDPFTNFINFLGKIFEGENPEDHDGTSSGTQRVILDNIKTFNRIVRIISEALVQPNQILTEDLFNMIIELLSQIQNSFDATKINLQFRTHVLVSLFGLSLIEILETQSYKECIKDVIKFKSHLEIVQACKGDLEQNFESCINPGFFQCSETGCKINPRTLLVANTHAEPAIRAEALKELQKFYETIARKKQEKINMSEQEHKLRSSMSKLAVSGGSAAEVQPDVCVVCMNGGKTHAFQPCGHKCVCATCAAQLQSCPICREPVTGSFQIFDS